MRTVTLLCIGAGRVGQAFIRHLDAYDSASRGLRFSIGAIARSRSIRMSDGGVIAREAGDWSAVASVARKLRDGSEDLVIIDVSDASTAPLHLDLVSDGFTVVTANKKPLVGPYSEYLELTEAIDPRGHRAYWFEATVGAGLPVVRTIRELVETGDRVERIEAVMSGTLNFLCDAHARKRPFGESVLEAMSLGLAEPDPRDDLLCKDIQRKAIILGRLAGAPFEDIGGIAPLLDASDAEKDLDSFVSGLKRRTRWPKAWPKIGQPMEYSFTTCPATSAAEAGLTPREPGRSALSGPENRFVIRTDRNGGVPIVISGPGAGADVTATAVFGDLLRSLARL